MNQGNSATYVDDIIESMVGEVNNGRNPEDVLDDYGLEPDYVFDLLNECI